jgi:hypothetical protein
VERTDNPAGPARETVRPPGSACGWHAPRGPARRWRPKTRSPLTIFAVARVGNHDRQGPAGPRTTPAPTGTPRTAQTAPCPHKPIRGSPAAHHLTNGVEGHQYLALGRTSDGKAIMDIDVGDAWDFVDDDGKPHKLRFRRNWAPQNDPRIFDGTGQLIAVVPDANRLDNHAEIAISRPNVQQADVERVLDGWEQWATPIDTGPYRLINLARIRRHIHAAGLG